MGAQWSDSAENSKHFQSFGKTDSVIPYMSANSKYVVTAERDSVRENGDYIDVFTITVFDKEGTKVHSFDTYEPNNTRLTKVIGVAITQDDHILVVSEEKHCILKFTKEGNLVATATQTQYGTESHILFPEGICVSPDGQVLVPGIDENRLEFRNPDLSLSRTIELLYPEDWSEITPKCIAVDSQGMLFTAIDDKIQKYSPDGHFQTEFVVNKPERIAIDENDNVYVSSNHGFILVFDTSGKFQYRFAEKLSLGGIAADKAGKLYVCDSSEILVKSLDTESPPTSGDNESAQTDKTETTFPSPYLWKLGKVSDGCGIAITNDGTVVVAEDENHSIVLIDKKGTKVRTFGSKGTDEGQFNTPHGVAVTQDGHIIVADEDNHRIQKFTMEGKFVASVGQKGSGELEFYLPRRLCVLPDGLILVADSGNDRIQALKPDLSFSHTVLSASGDEQGEFDGLYDLAVDGEGMLYVVDLDGNRVQKLTPEGKFVLEFGRRKMDEPHSIAVDPLSNTVYVCDKEHSGISMYDTSGNFKWRFGYDASKSPQGLTVDKTGHLYFCGRDGVYMSIPASSIPRVVTSDGKGDSLGEIIGPHSLAISPNTDHIALIEYSVDHHAVKVLDKQGKVITQFDCSETPDRKKLTEPYAVAVTPDNMFLLTDRWGHSVHKFTFEGKMVATVGSSTSGKGELEFDRPHGILVHPNGKIFVADTHNYRIQVLNSDFSFSHFIGTGEDDKKHDKFRYPTDVAADSQGMVYITDMLDNRVKKFTPDGEFIIEFGCNVPEDSFTFPDHILVHGDVVYVCTDFNMSLFNTSGLLLARFGKKFRGIDFDEAGKLYVCDEDNKTVVAL